MMIKAKGEVVHEVGLENKLWAKNKNALEAGTYGQNLDSEKVKEIQDVKISPPPKKK